MRTPATQPMTDFVIDMRACSATSSSGVRYHCATTEPPCMTTNASVSVSSRQTRTDVVVPSTRVIGRSRIASGGDTGSAAGAGIGAEVGAGTGSGAPGAARSAAGGAGASGVVAGGVVGRAAGGASVTGAVAARPKVASGAGNSGARWGVVASGTRRPRGLIAPFRTRTCRGPYRGIAAGGCPTGVLPREPLESAKMASCQVTSQATLRVPRGRGRGRSTGADRTSSCSAGRARAVLSRRLS